MSKARKEQQQSSNLANGSSSLSTALLLLGALVGVVLAGSELFEAAPAPHDSEVLAEVNAWTIRRSDFEQFVRSLERGKRKPLSDSERSNLLQRMIDEKLILQRGLELGLLENEASVRKAVSNAMIQTITAEVSALEPDDSDLEAFYSNNIHYFAQPARLRVQSLSFLKKENSKQAYQRALAAYNALQQGETPERVQQRLADKAVLEVPNTLLPPHKLRDYIGPKLLELASTMPSGQVSAPQEQTEEYVVLLVYENQPSSDVPLAKVRPRVLREYQRRAAEQALRDYLDVLKLEADIRIAPEFTGADEEPVLPAAMRP